ncbi:MAG: CPBP family intramembrane metalloprotease [Bacteroidales bacterium]|jgi:membrane protease YdiL (CAAX protease family)|nr:CPBP family intramembrane metalloprotease [Bacteroidales bacterium]
MNHIERALNDNNKNWGWYLLVFICAFVASNMIGAIPMLIVAFKSAFSGGVDMQSGLENVQSLFQNLNPQTLGIEKNLWLLVMLFPFAILFLTAVLLIKTFHKRSFAEVINGTKRIRWNRIFWGFGVWFLLSAIIFVITYFIHPQDFTFNFQGEKFAILLLISLLLLPIQTTSEEFLFRGYLLQGFGVWTKSRPIAWICTSVLFALMHILNPEVGAMGGSIMLQYLWLGLLLGLPAILDDGIEVSIGLHAANNLFACLFLTTDVSALQTDALFKCRLNSGHSFEDFWWLVLASVVFIAILKRKFGWSLATLTQKVVPKEETYEPF